MHALTLAQNDKSYSCEYNIYEITTPFPLHHKLDRFLYATTEGRWSRVATPPFPFNSEAATTAVALGRSVLKALFQLIRQAALDNDCIYNGTMKRVSDSDDSCYVSISTLSLTLMEVNRPMDS